MVFLIGVISLNMGIALSAEPFLATAVYTVLHHHRLKSYQDL